VAEDGRIRCTHLIHEGADALETGRVIRLAEIDSAADLRMHFCAAQFFGGSFLADGGLHQCWTGKK